MNFIEWLESRGLLEAEVEMDNEFETGTKTPAPQLQRIANKMVATAGPDLFNQIKTAPSQGMAQKRLMGITQQGFKHLNPNMQKKFPVGDIATAAATSMGFKDLMKGTVA